MFLSLECLLLLKMTYDGPSAKTGPSFFLRYLLLLFAIALSHVLSHPSGHRQSVLVRQHLQLSGCFVIKRKSKLLGLWHINDPWYSGGLHSIYMGRCSETAF